MNKFGCQTPHYQDHSMIHISIVLPVHLKTFPPNAGSAEEL